MVKKDAAAQVVAVAKAAALLRSVATKLVVAALMDAVAAAAALLRSVAKLCKKW